MGRAELELLVLEDEVYVAKVVAVDIELEE